MYVYCRQIVEQPLIDGSSRLKEEGRRAVAQKQVGHTDVPGVFSDRERHVIADDGVDLKSLFPGVEDVFKQKRILMGFFPCPADKEGDGSPGIRTRVSIHGKIIS